VSEGSVEITGQVAIVTGGTRGVGRGIAQALLIAGADVVICGRNEPEQPILETGPDGNERYAHFITADVRDASDAAKVVDETIERFGRLDVLVNNAGGSPSALASEASPRFIERVIALNLLAPFFCAQVANAAMQKQASGGQIINIGSVAATRPSPGTAAYAAAKAGLINLTETLAVEWAPKVRVNCISAGLLDSGAGPEHYGGEEGMARVAGTVPLGRMGTPEDVAGLVLALVGPFAPYLSGANIVLHGGGEWPAFLRAQGEAGKGS
jgi:NAD(P)-dependent dehydrogenase (short-subunit alcohol dehydrogenase family)